MLQSSLIFLLISFKIVVFVFVSNLVPNYGFIGWLHMLARFQTVNTFSTLHRLTSFVVFFLLSCNDSGNNDG